jgi:hypothetical protein
MEEQTPEQLERRFYQQKIIFRNRIDDKTEAHLAVFYGPFPHPSAAKFGVEPDMYQVVWQRFIGGIPEHYVDDFIFTAMKDPHPIVIWLPPNANMVKKLIKENWGLDIEIPSFSN